THAALEGQDTPISAVARKTSSDVPSAPVTLGDAWIVHAEPCCVSASVRQAPGESRYAAPTAAQAPAAAQDTPASWLWAAPGGPAGACAVQVVPSQTSASARFGSKPGPCHPTAVHEVAVAQETAARLP